MARLNEPPIPTADNIDSLRRKFLRQNRDIARVNSAQSLKIRDLENEIARLLSENLELHSQNFRLQKHQQDNSAQRTADHALAIKAKMEAQMIEWGAMLSTLGVEPPFKRHSPEKRRRAQHKSGLHQSPARRRPREFIPDSKELAAAEGRLGPLFEEAENRRQSRQTLNHEEIMALVSRDESQTGSAGSPDLGPPPVSRFVDEDPIKISSPLSQLKVTETSVYQQESSTITSPERLQPYRDNPLKPTAAEPEPQKKSLSRTADKLSVTTTSSQPAKTGSKRKFAISDENEIAAGLSKGSSENSKPSRTADTPLASSKLKGRRTIKDLTVNRRETKEKVAAALQNSANARKPLAVKSTNDDVVGSPKKNVTTEAAGMKKPKPLDDSASKDRPKEYPKAKRIVELPSRPPLVPIKLAIVDPAPVDIIPDAVLEKLPLAPDTPDRFAPKRETNDTPPPADISSQGEASRPNRRSRAAVSYAEPNLRDKMRRPTKELFDAVSGEGKRIARPSMKAEDIQTELPSASKQGPEAQVFGEGGDQARYNSMVNRLGPLVHSSSTSDLSTLSSVSERRKRPSSSIGLRSPLQETELVRSALISQAAAAPDAAPTPEADPYEFKISSPTSSGHEAPKDTKEAPAVARTSRHRRSTATHDTADRAAKPSASRKRASMAGPKKPAMYDDDEADDDSSYTPSGSAEDRSLNSSGLSTRDRVSRRRSMML